MIGEVALGLGELGIRFVLRFDANGIDLIGSCKCFELFEMGI